RDRNVTGVQTCALPISLGVEDSKRAFVHYPANTFANQADPLQDNTHFNTYGAYQIAKMVLQGIKENQLDVAKHIIDFSFYDPSKIGRASCREIEMNKVK